MEYDIIIKPQHGFRSINFIDLYKYRELMFTLIWRDIKVRYKQTALGASWAIFQPLISMLILYVIFGILLKVPSDNYPYPIFVFTGLLPWTFFSTSLADASTSLISHGNLISKIYFPRLIVPISTIGARLFDFFISSIILIGLMWYYNIPISINVILIPILIIGSILSSLGIGIFLSAVSVAYRDIKHIIPFILQIWMYATPVIYPSSIFPKRWGWILYFNPMAGLIEGYRSVLLGRSLNSYNIIISLVISIVLFYCGVIYFKRIERTFSDII